jgi:hypothetical protein
MAEVRLDIEDVYDNMDTLQKAINDQMDIIQEQKGQMYNYKVGLTILSVFVFISYIIK